VRRTLLLPLIVSCAPLIQQLALSLGVTAGAYALQVAGWLRGGDGVTVTDFRVAFVAVGLLAKMSVIPIARLPANAGAELAGREPPPDAPPPMHARDPDPP